MPKGITDNKDLTFYFLTKSTMKTSCSIMTPIQGIPTPSWACHRQDVCIIQQKQALGWAY